MTSGPASIADDWIYAAVIADSAAVLAPGGHTYVAIPNLWHEHPPQTFHFAPHLSQFTLRSLAGGNTERPTRARASSRCSSSWLRRAITLIGSADG